MATAVFSRRQVIGGLVGAVFGVSGSALAQTAEREAALPGGVPFRFCLNTATVRSHRLSLIEEVKLAAKVGYQGIEPWTSEINSFLSSGGVLADVRKALQDHGLAVESAIGFPTWIVDDEEQRRRGFEQMQREMEWLAELGGKRIAAPPAGANNGPTIDLRRVAERYVQLLELGRSLGVVPQLEIWGASANLSRLSEAAYVLVECGQPDAGAIFDVFHIYRGGSPFTGLRMFNGGALRVFHMNDYPADPPREKIRDADRVFPGDGVAPLVEIVRTLYEIGSHAALSLELFNPNYASLPPEDVAQTGLEKMKRCVARALAGKGAG